jgi:hypothetical protein
MNAAYTHAAEILHEWDKYNKQRKTRVLANETSYQ